MDREEILERSRAENRNKDIYELEILKQASAKATIVMMILVGVFTIVQMLLGGGIHWGLWALSFTPEMVTLWVKYMRFHHKRELAMAVVYTVMVSVMSGYHVYCLIASSLVL